MVIPPGPLSPSTASRLSQLLDRLENGKNLGSDGSIKFLRSGSKLLLTTGSDQSGGGGSLTVEEADGTPS